MFLRKKKTEKKRKKGEVFQHLYVLHVISKSINFDENKRMLMQSNNIFEYTSFKKKWRHIAISLSRHFTDIGRTGVGILIIT